MMWLRCTAIMILFSAGAALAEDGSTPIIEDKVIEGVHVRWRRPEIPPRVTSVRADEVRSIAGPPIFTPAREFVPLGIYTGDYGDATWPFVFRDIRRQYGNTYYPNGIASWPLEWTFADVEQTSRIFTDTREGTEAICRLAAASGIRLYQQSSNLPIHWPVRINMGPPREEVYERAIKWADETLPAFASDPELKAGLLVWGITEEIDIETARDPLLKKLKERMEHLDPHHPPIILIMTHTLDVQQAMIESWGSVPIVVTDHYLNHRSVPPQSVSGFNLHRLKIWSDLARQAKAKFWLVPACFSMMNHPDPEVAEGHRILLPQEVSMSLWTGLAYGASGFMLFKYYDDDAFGRACLTRFDWQPTEEYIAAGRFFRRVARLAPLVGRWSLTEDVAVHDGVAVGTFEHPDYRGRFLVAANVDSDRPAAFVAPADAYELEGLTRVRGKLELSGGSGAILFRGTDEELAKLKDQLSVTPGMAPLEERRIQPNAAQVWTMGENERFTASPKTVSIRTSIRFGGKGAVPIVFRPNLDTPARGELLEWGEGVRVPAQMYYSPRPGPGETAVFLKWDVSGVRDVEVDRAAINLRFDGGLAGGRIALYPIIDEPAMPDDKTENMPRWEMQVLAQGQEQVSAEITGIVSQWISGEMANNGLLLVYEGFPTEHRHATLAAAPVLELEYVAKGGD